MGKLRADWRTWLVVGTLACALYPVLPNEGVAAAVLYSIVGLGSFAVTVAAVRRYRPPHGGAWLLFGTGQLMWALGDIVYELIRHVLHETPYPSLADAFYLGAYPLYLVAVWRLTRRRFRRDLAGLLDALIIAVGVGLVYWVFVIAPIVADGATPGFVRVISVGYPASDVLIFALLVRTLTAGRPPTGLRLLTAGLAVLVVTDTAYSIVNLVSVYEGGLLGSGWLAAYVLWTAAALHPSMHAPAPDGAAAAAPFGRRRLVVLTACSLLAPAVLFVQGALFPGRLSWLAIGLCAAALFLLVLARLSGFVAQAQGQARQLEDLAMRDELTGLANGRRFEQRLTEALAAGSPQVMLLDLTGFKNVNDRFGHQVGDELLAAVAGRLAAKVRFGDLVARLGGDEFVVLLTDATDAEAEAVADRLGDALRRPFAAGDHDLLISASIGLAGADGSDDVARLLRRADTAMYAAKRQGVKRRRWTPELDAATGERTRLAADLRTALDTGELHLAYQPIVTLPEGRMVGAEALVRWEHPTRGLIPPAEFIPVADETGLIVELGAWVLRTACAQGAAWRAELGPRAPERISVNVSARQLAEPGFVSQVATALAWTGLGAQRLVIEVTETAVFGGGVSVQAVKDLRELGVRVALDDFGTGHSSLGLLQTVPVDLLKVDKSFVDGITGGGPHPVIVAALVDLGAGLGLGVVAEGVETAGQAAELHRLGYRLAQGYHFGRPVPAAEFIGARTAR